MAHEGTLFLDELGEMPMELQPKLLRVLEDGLVWQVGGREGKKVDVRAVAATNVDLQRRIQEERFRSDLYFRIAHFTVTAPPLREPGRTSHFWLSISCNWRPKRRDTTPPISAHRPSPA